MMSGPGGQRTRTARGLCGRVEHRRAVAPAGPGRAGGFKAPAAASGRPERFRRRLGLGLAGRARLPPARRRRLLGVPEPSPKSRAGSERARPPAASPLTRAPARAFDSAFELPELGRKLRRGGSPSRLAGRRAAQARHGPGPA